LAGRGCADEKFGLAIVAVIHDGGDYQGQIDDSQALV
jgi:hypothetical protein